MPVWLRALVLAAGVLPLPGVFVWSCLQTVTIRYGGHGVNFGGGDSVTLALLRDSRNPLTNRRYPRGCWQTRTPDFMGKRYAVWWF